MQPPPPSAVTPASTIELKAAHGQYALAAIPVLFLAVPFFFSPLAPLLAGARMTWLHWLMLALGLFFVTVIPLCWIYALTSRIVVTEHFFGVARFGRTPRWLPRAAVGAVQYHHYRAKGLTAWHSAGRHTDKNGMRMYVLDQSGERILKLYEQIWTRNNLEYLQQLLTGDGAADTA
ncbi:hypothetical protein [Hoyosella subflava]|uniref:PH domain-containing protein n=1 Tax=Hoyosella subflava (strain DSM 45089 / JCM 17490 / NBRC 109087 / DQS3-9A1) TaxID=443218 RepID=F6EKS8_HOYSD|nr:hypothetical protein [Hoyosella subflava]AEF41408.1 hypothetical protein AS9A_2961 [Hoyosella subflava DQS3-9A1]